MLKKKEKEEEEDDIKTHQIVNVNDLRRQYRLAVGALFFVLLQFCLFLPCSKKRLPTMYQRFCLKIKRY
jgi:hypothetical protein